jgi:hypothetical protein
MAELEMVYYLFTTKTTHFFEVMPALVKNPLEIDRTLSLSYFSPAWSFLNDCPDQLLVISRTPNQKSVLFWSVFSAFSGFLGNFSEFSAHLMRIQAFFFELSVYSGEALPLAETRITPFLFYFRYDYLLNLPAMDKILLHAEVMK